MQEQYPELVHNGRPHAPSQAEARVHLEVGNVTEGADALVGDLQLLLACLLLNSTHAINLEDKLIAVAFGPPKAGLHLAPEFNIWQRVHQVKVSY